MTSLLVVITFLAGSAWGPVVSTTPAARKEECRAVAQAVAREIVTASATNVNGGAQAVEEGATIMITAGVTGTREMARISCLTDHGRAAGG